jgi:hypothetical protein
LWSIAVTPVNHMECPRALWDDTFVCVCTYDWDLLGKLCHGAPLIHSRIFSRVCWAHFLG